MDVNYLKKLVSDMEIYLAFDNIEAEDCSLCCTSGNGGTVGC